MTIAPRVQRTFADSGYSHGKVPPEEGQLAPRSPWTGSMPSQLHEVLLELFRNRPLLAPELLRDALHVELPTFAEARIDSADLNDLQPASYQADLVVRLIETVAVLGIVVEVQSSPKERKRFVWPAYVANL